jgi:hypothetical protein
MVKIRGKPLIVPNDGVDHYDAPHGCMAMLGTGCCSYMVGDKEIQCCFADGRYPGHDCKGNPEMNCTYRTRKDEKTVAYKRIN